MINRSAFPRSVKLNLVRSICGSSCTAIESFTEQPPSCAGQHAGNPLCFMIYFRLRNITRNRDKWLALPCSVGRIHARRFGRFSIKWWSCPLPKKAIHPIVGTHVVGTHGTLANRTEVNKSIHSSFLMLSHGDFGQAVAVISCRAWLSAVSRDIPPSYSLIAARSS